MNSSTAWDDLPLRLASAVILLLICGLALWSGDFVFTLLLAGILFIMHWELAHMLTPMSKQVGACQRNHRGADADIGFAQSR
jgi:phosphatidate cytidylyltransferase